MANFPTIQGMGGSLQNALKEKVKVQTTPSGGLQHIRYDSYTGQWSYGKDGEDITGDEVTVITPSICHGWHRWKDREVFKRMVNFLDDLPEKPEAVEDRKGKVQVANEARGFQCMLDGATQADDLQLSWEHSTDGCRRAIDTLLEATMSRAQTEAEYLYPVVKLENDTPYENSYKDGEMIYPPMLTITGWRDHEGNDAPEEVAQVEDKTPPKKTRATKTVKEPDPETDPETPEAAHEAEEESKTEEPERPRRQRRRNRTKSAE